MTIQIASGRQGEWGATDGKSVPSWGYLSGLPERQVQSLACASC